MRSLVLLFAMLACGCSFGAPSVATSLRGPMPAARPDLWALETHDPA